MPPSVAAPAIIATMSKCDAHHRPTQSSNATPRTPVKPRSRLMTDRLNIELHAVSVQRGDTWALRNISLRLNAGERWALIGGNGAGKTQLLKLLGTDVWPTPTGRETRTYSLAAG